MLERQFSLFESCDSVDLAEGSRWKMFIDGASRGNPGPAACGIVLYQDEILCKKEGFFLGTMTNNQAEYIALGVGLLLVKEEMKQHDSLAIISDSQLLVRQMQGVYKVKNSDLVRLHMFASHLLSGVSYTIEHVLREYNQEADAIANQAFETKKKVPTVFVELMKAYEIIL